MPKISKYLRFGIAYCNYKNLFKFDAIGKQKIYEPEDIWEGILMMYDHENRNRGNKPNKDKK